MTAEIGRVMQTPRIVPVLASALAMLVVAACATTDDADSPIEDSDGEPDVEEPDEPDATPDAGEGDAPRQLRVMMGNEFDPLYPGVEAGEIFGLFADAGIEIDLVYGQAGAEAIAAGEVDIAVGSPNRFVGAVLEGLEATFIGTTTKEWPQDIIVSNELDVPSVDAWAGGDLGVSRFGSAGHYAAEKLAEELGWTEADYEIVPLGDLDGLLAGLRSGAIDGFMWGGIAGLQMEAEGVATVLGNMTEIISSNPAAAIIAANSVVEAHPDVVRDFCDAFYLAQDRLQSDLDLATTLFIDEFDYSPELAPQMIQDTAPYLATDDQISEEMFENMAETVVFTVDGVDALSASDVADMYTPCSAI